MPAFDMIVLFALCCLSIYGFVPKKCPTAAPPPVDGDEDDRVDEALRQLERIDEARAAMARDIGQSPDIVH